MPYIEERTYFLYGKGFEPEQLSLGHLVFGDYKNPTLRKYHSFPRLDDAELRNVAYVRDWRGMLTTAKKGNLGFNLLILGGGEIGPQFSTESRKVISAEKARRVELKEPKKFLSRVLTNPDAKAKLQLWTSVMRSQYMMMRLGLRKKPKIWMLTGLLELEDGKSHTVKSKDVALSFGIDPAAVTALCGAPVGGSVELGRGVSLEVESQLSGTMVWAAKFQLLKTEFKKWDGKTEMAENEFRLHPDDIFAGNVVLGGGDGEELVELTLDMTESDNEDLDQSYWEAYEEAESRMLEDLAAPEGEY